MQVIGEQVAALVVRPISDALACLVASDDGSTAWEGKARQVPAGSCQREPMPRRRTVRISTKPWDESRPALQYEKRCMVLLQQR